jgi:hypothetical protein
MMDGLTLEQLGVADWQIIELQGECLLLYRDIHAGNDEPHGFDFCCVEFCSQECRDSAPIQYNVLFEGITYFDGVRHLYFGSEKTDNYGYLYYCDVPLLIVSLQKLDDLQVRKCPYVADERKKSNDSKVEP